MSPTLEVTKKVVKTVILLDFIIVVLLLMTSKFDMEILYGLIFGSFFSILNFRIFALNLEKALTMPSGKAQAYTVSKYYLRMVLTGIVILISLKADYINAIGTIIGLILPSISIYISNIFLNSKKA